jgi:hypothetical protein
MKSDETILGYCLAEIHVDFDFVYSVSIAYNLRHQLIVELEYYLLETPQDVTRTIAIVSADDAFLLSRRLRIGMKDIPSHIADIFKYQEYFDNWKVTKRFQDVLRFLLRNGAHYRLIRESKY